MLDVDGEGSSLSLRLASVRVGSGPAVFFAASVGSGSAVFFAASDGSGSSVSLGVGVGVGVGVALSDGSGVAVALGLGVGVADLVLDGLGVGVAVRVALGVADGVALGLVVVPRFLIGPSGRGDGLPVRRIAEQRLDIDDGKLRSHLQTRFSNGIGKNETTEQSELTEQTERENIFRSFPYF